jgi:energy-converting hydrogenase Eha subunit A
MQQVNANTGINIGVAVAVIVVSIIVALLFNIPVSRSLYQIRACFARIQRMDLDAPIISKTMNAFFINYETAELKKSFQAMLSTLRSFQKYVPPHVVQQLLLNRKEAELGLEGEICTVMFIDIKGKSYI